jgi:hypothetical protein
MNATLRKFGRGSAALAGTFALGLSLAACGGGDETEETTEAEAPAAETTEEAPAESDGGGDAVAGDETTDDSADDTTDESDDADSEDSGSTEVTDDDLSNAKDQTMGFFEALADGDNSKACGFFLDPTTGDPAEGEVKEACGEYLDDNESLSSLTPETVDLIEDQIETVDNGDGTIGIEAGGSDMGLHMEKGSDGNWYFVTQ